MLQVSPVALAVGLGHLDFASAHRHFLGEFVIELLEVADLPDHLLEVAVGLSPCLPLLLELSGQPHQF